MNTKQKIAIAVMAALGLLLAAWILTPRRGADGEAQSQPRSTASDPHDKAPPTEEITLSDAQLKVAGVTLAVAAPASIAVSITLPGEIRFNEDRTAHVVPRLAGVVTAVHAELGQQVRKGQVLATLASGGLSDLRSELLSAERRLALARTTYQRERKLWQDKISAEQDYLQAQQAMNEADIAAQNAQQKLNAYGADVSADARVANGVVLNRLELRAPFDGIVMEKHLAPGEAVREDANVFTIADLSTVWAEIAVPAGDLDRVRVGATATVRAAAFNATASGKVSYVGALLGEQTRTARARVVLANPERAWRPGLFVNVELRAGQADAAVTVATEALQTIDDKPVVFVKTPHGYAPQALVLGRGDGRLTEVLQGLKAGAQYAASGSFVLKAELGKDSAAHAH